MSQNGDPAAEGTGSAECGLWDVVGATEPVALLQRMVAEDRAPHALILSGPAQVGKRRLALELACALNHEGDGCRHCGRIRGGKHADVEMVSPGGLTLDPATDRPDSRFITIAQVRRLEMVASTHAYEGRRRVFILEPADTLNRDAADAFLKTLEEPPAQVTFVLVTSRPQLLPETVRSRCTELRVPPMAIAAMADWLSAAHGLDVEAAAMLARMAQGRVGRAIEMLGEGDAFEVRRGQVEEILRLWQQGHAERFKFAEGLVPRLVGEPVNALVALRQWTSWWRDVLLVGAGCAEGVTHTAHSEALQRAAAECAPADVARFLLAAEGAERRVREGVNARLALDVLFASLPEPRSGRRIVDAGV